MLKFLLFTLLLTPLQQADEIQTHRGKEPIPCFIVKMSYRKVYYKLVIKSAKGIEILPQTQEMDASEIKELTLRPVLPGEIPKKQASPLWVNRRESLLKFGYDPRDTATP